MQPPYWRNDHVKIAMSNLVKTGGLHKTQSLGGLSRRRPMWRGQRWPYRGLELNGMAVGDELAKKH